MKAIEIIFKALGYLIAAAAVLAFLAAVMLFGADCGMPL